MNLDEHAFCTRLEDAAMDLPDPSSFPDGSKEDRGGFRFICLRLKDRHQDWFSQWALVGMNGEILGITFCRVYDAP
jgi:hypothetical protein